MKVDLKLSADELHDMLDAVAEAALDRDYDIDDPIFMKEMFEIVDAALKALNVEIIPADRADDDEEPNEMEFDCEGDCANCPDPCPEYTGEDEDEEEEEELEYPDTPVSRRVFLVDGMRAIKESDANEIVETLKNSVNEMFYFLPEQARQKIFADGFFRVCEENGIQIVVKGI